MEGDQLEDTCKIAYHLFILNLIYRKLKKKYNLVNCKLANVHSQNSFSHVL